MDIQFEKVNYIYQADTPMASPALFDIDLTIPEGSYTAIVGHTGSGKSTLLQHLNALLKPTSGVVHIGDTAITNETKNKHLKALRKQVGIVFQFPEAQLFEETVEKDIAFGPQNFGMSQEDALQLAKEKLLLVGLDESYLGRSPFELSGGQMRRVAIAGVLALEPLVLVLDEPTAGLDPKGRKELMEMFADLHEKQGLTIVLVTHQMDDVAEFADHLIVMEKGHVVKEGAPQEIFQDEAWLREKNLDVPSAMLFAKELEAKGFKFDKMPLTLETLADQLAGAILQKGRV